jgi:hypothetical protein
MVVIRENYIKVLDSEIERVNSKKSDYYKGYFEAIEMAKRQFNIAFVESCMCRNGESKDEFIDWIVENSDTIKLAIDTQDRKLLEQVFSMR